ncbi:MAG: hypothetical protein WCT52_03500 [Candidatus Micrarchaeia archaeon]
MQVQPGSQHAKFLPVIRETIAKAKAAKIFEKYKQCVEGLKIPSLSDVRRTYQCTLAEAESGGLIDKETMVAIRRAFSENFSDVFDTEGTDGFKYQVDNNDKPAKVYALHIEGVRMTEELFMGMKRNIRPATFQSAENLIKEVLSEETPTFELSSGTSLKDYILAFHNLAAVLPKDRQDAWMDIDTEMKLALSERGYRSDSDVSTWQEHTLAGSTVSISYSEQPYKPLGRIDSEIGRRGEHRLLEIGEAKVARELGAFTGVHFEYYGLPDNDRRLHVFFEPLDSYGNTVRDPRAIDTAKLGEFLKLYPLEDAIEKCLIPGVVKREDYPNRRD